jgi:hypothetical protein
MVTKGGAKSDWRSRTREEQILLMENWVKAFQGRGAGWGIQPGELVDLIVTLLEAKEALAAAANGGGEALEASCNKAFHAMEQAARAIKQRYLLSASAPSRPAGTDPAAAPEPPRRTMNG